MVYLRDVVVRADIDDVETEVHSTHNVGVVCGGIVGKQHAFVRRKVFGGTQSGVTLPVGIGNPDIDGSEFGTVLVVDRDGSVLVTVFGGAVTDPGTEMIPPATSIRTTRMPTSTTMIADMMRRVFMERR